MKKLMMITGLFAVLMIGLWAVSAAPVSFAGTWILDKGKSELTGRMASIEGLTWTITQDDKQLTLKPEVAGGGGGGGGRGMGMMNQPQTYNLDGSETTSEFNAGQFSGKITRKARWNGKVLELSSVITTDNGSRSTTEHWELAEDGKVLSVHRKQETPNGSMESKLVFNRKQ